MLAIHSERSTDMNIKFEWHDRNPHLIAQRIINKEESVSVVDMCLSESAHNALSDKTVEVLLESAKKESKEVEKYRKELVSLAAKLEQKAGELFSEAELKLYRQLAKVLTDKSFILLAKSNKKIISGIPPKIKIDKRYLANLRKQHSVYKYVDGKIIANFLKAVYIFMDSIYRLSKGSAKIYGRFKELSLLDQLRKEDLNAYTMLRLNALIGYILDNSGLSREQFNNAATIVLGLPLLLSYSLGYIAKAAQGKTSIDELSDNPEKLEAFLKKHQKGLNKYLAGMTKTYLVAANRTVKAEEKLKKMVEELKRQQKKYENQIAKAKKNAATKKESSKSKTINETLYGIHNPLHREIQYLTEAWYDPILKVLKFISKHLFIIGVKIGVVVGWFVDGALYVVSPFRKLIAPIVRPVIEARAGLERFLARGIATAISNYGVPENMAETIGQSIAGYMFNFAGYMLSSLVMPTPIKYVIAGYTGLYKTYEFLTLYVEKAQKIRDMSNVARLADTVREQIDALNEFWDSIVLPEEEDTEEEDEY